MRAAVVRVGNTILPGILYAQGLSVELWIPTSDEAGVVEGLAVQPSLAFLPVIRSSPSWKWLPGTVCRPTPDDLSLECE